METISINIYKFNELSDEAKQKAIDKLWDINFGYDWWDFIYEDAKLIGLKITGFDLDRNKHCTGILIDGMPECCRLIMANHGNKTDTYYTALNYLEDYDKLVEKYSDGINKDIVSEDNTWEFDKEADELEEEFLNSILEDYANILQKEYEYLSSEEAIIETIEANDYDFTEDGNIY